MTNTILNTYEELKMKHHIDEERPTKEVKGWDNNSDIKLTPAKDELDSFYLSFVEEYAKDKSCHCILGNNDSIEIYPLDKVNIFLEYTGNKTDNKYWLMDIGEFNNNKLKMDIQSGYIYVSTFLLTTSFNRFVNGIYFTEVKYRKELPLGDEVNIRLRIFNKPLT